MVGIAKIVRATVFHFGLQSRDSEDYLTLKGIDKPIDLIYNICH